MEFNPRYVRIMWSEEMEGNKCLVSDRISDLKRIVEEGLLEGYGRVEQTGSRDFPFRSNGSLWRFAYFDPYFTLKQAREEGKTIERFLKSENEWEEWIDDEFPGDLALYRIKPEEENPVTNKELALWLARGNGQMYHLDDRGFRTKVKTSHTYHQDEDNWDCNRCKNFNCKIRKWGDTEWEHLLVNTWGWRNDGRRGICVRNQIRWPLGRQRMDLLPEKVQRGKGAYNFYRLARLPKEVGLEYNKGFRCSLSDAGMRRHFGAFMQGERPRKQHTKEIA